eukprot:TRINITY_DN37729_c0_g1_i1.p1 TRINITY_DN37729_c0_g1~~TRINITY_DN37729_c0_g1_i1.p1  ORF type:complete len:366 (-),score=122.71 TRINITY_DN37729_c0_g1_i1:77-1096(-)
MEAAALLVKKGVPKATADALGEQLLGACTDAAWDRACNLVKCGACATATDSEERTALMLAVEAEQQDLLQLLLENGADAKAKNKNGETAFMLAMQQGKSEMVAILAKGLSKEEQQMVNKRLIDSCVKCGKGDLAKAQFALASCASLAAKHGDGRPIIQVVMESKGKERLDLLKLLLEKGASKKAATKDKRSMLKLAYDMGDMDALTLFKGNKFALLSTETKDVQDQFMKNCTGGKEKLSAIKMGILVGAQVDHLEGDMTPLSAAVNSATEPGDLEVVKLLVEAGAPVNVRVGMYSVTPLYMAASKKKKEIAAYLVKNGANKDKDDSEGQAEYDKLMKKK